MIYFWNFIGYLMTTMIMQKIFTYIYDIYEDFKDSIIYAALVSGLLIIAYVFVTQNFYFNNMIIDILVIFITTLVSGFVFYTYRLGRNKSVPYRDPSERVNEKRVIKDLLSVVSAFFIWSLKAIAVLACAAFLFYLYKQNVPDANKYKELESNYNNLESRYEEQENEIKDLKDRLDASESRLDDICNTTNGNLGC